MPETSDRTFLTLVDGTEPAPTVMAFGMGNSKYTQTYLLRAMPPPPEVLTLEPEDSPLCPRSSSRH